MLTKDFLKSIATPPPMTKEDLLFGQAVESFESGDDKEALLLCRKIMALEGRRAAEAEHYLGLLEKREQWLFQKAVELFEDDDDEEAGLLFRQVIALSGANAGESIHYLELLNQRADEMLLVEAKHLLQIERYPEAYDYFKAAADLNLAHSSEAGRYMENVKTLISQKFAGQGPPDLPAFSRYVDTAGWLSVGEPRQDKSVDDIIRKTPHMDIGLESELQPGSTFDVFLFVDNSQARPGEESDEVMLEALSGVNIFETQVRLLATGHFVIEGQAVKTILIHRSEERSDSARFIVRVKSEVDLASQYADLKAGLTAVFAYNGRISGKVSRTIRIAGIKTPVVGEAGSHVIGKGEATEVATPKPPLIRIDAFARPADLTVEIVAQGTNDGQHFWCTVRAPQLEKYAGGVAGEWNLPGFASRIVGDYMDEFTTEGMGREMRITALRGAGMKLFDASPKVFQEVFWELIDKGKVPRTIAIVSEEPYIPWELMIPWRRLDRKTSRREKPLGVEFIIGRWTKAMSARQRIPLTDCYVIAPNYVEKRQLEYAQAESRFMLQRFSTGQAIRPATFENISATFEKGGKTLVHFACHGATTNTGRQLIDLENPPPLSADMVLAMGSLVKAFEEKQPLVFLNACEVGRQVPSLLGVGGFAQSFIDLGASAVIAPLWSVKDKLAHQVALDFYNAISAHPDKPFAEIIREIRAKAYDPQIGEDTYAAYCFYGDPLGSGASN